MERMKQLAEEAIAHALKTVTKNLERFGKDGRGYPHVSTKLIYTEEENKLWTASFFPGMVYLAHELSGEQEFLKYRKDYLKSIRHRLQYGHTNTHDIGFLCTLFAVADYKITGEEEAREIARLGAQFLAGRYHEKGQYIQAWNDLDAEYPDVKIIIDTMLNLPLLYWTGEEEYIRMAKNHAYTCAKTIIREDASSFHTYLMNPKTGEAVMGKTHQGHRDDSTWARGQAWAVYGFALSYDYTKEADFLDVACRCADYFLNHLPEDHVPYWDLDFTDENPDIRDTSAGAILACGLLELCRHVGAEQQERYRQAAHGIIKSMYENYTTGDTESNGILKEGMYHRNHGFRECVIWGDYFYMEAWMRLVKDDWNRYW